MISAILLMAGTGSRMNMNQNKILLPLGNVRIYEYSLSKFLSLGFEVICVVHEDDLPYFTEKLPSNVKLTLGGNTRQESVLEGLRLCSGEYVLVHDAARPLISIDILKDIQASYSMDEAILTYLPVKDTIKRVVGDEISTLLRNELLAATTPQGAPTAILRDAYLKSFKDSFAATDDISLIEAYYPQMKIKRILSNEENFKITTKTDYTLASILVEEKKCE